MVKECAIVWYIDPELTPGGSFEGSGSASDFITQRSHLIRMDCRVLHPCQPARLIVSATCAILMQ